MKRFTEKLSMATLYGSYIKPLNQIEKIPLVIIVYFGLTPIENQARIVLPQLL
ncbi:MAG: hypothetical protein WCI71_01690 [Bacteroidota bacterium]